MKKTLLTLCVIHNDIHILLGKKKRGFGEGKWNGFGGHVETGEAIEDAARREVVEEIEVIPHNLRHRGVLNFEIETFPELLEVHVFSTQDFEGEPKETEEMQPKWFDLSAIPFDEMWADDKYWLPLLLEGKNFIGNFYFKDNQTITQHEIKIL